MDPNQISIDTFNDLASQYQEKYFHLQQYNASYDRFCELVHNSGAKILELGCGPGNISHYLTKKRPDFKLLLSDAAPKMLELAKQNNPDAEVLVLDLRAIKTLNATYDGIVAGFCLPYLNKEDALKFLNDCFDLLNTGGILYLSTIEGEYARSGKQTGTNTGRSVYMYYYTEQELRDTLIHEGFDVLTVERLPFVMSDGTVNTDLLLILRKS